MEWNVKINTADISDYVLKEVITTAKAAVKAEITKLTGELRELITQQAADLSAALSIKDEKRRERVKRTLTRSLDKWTQGVLHDGR